MKTRLHRPRRARSVSALLLTALLAAPIWAAPRPQVQLQCASHDTGPQLSCTVLLRTAGGDAIADAHLQLSASMPSMAMAHTIPPVTATPTGRAGEYQGTLALEMPGMWAVAIDLRSPVRDKLMHTLLVNACPAGQRCAAGPMPHGKANTPSPAHEHMSHKH